MTTCDGMLFDRQSLPLEGRPSAGAAGRSRQKLLVASRELEVGRAAEHLVCADLLLGGWSAYPTAQGMAYDLAVDTAGRVIRVQVKATYYPRHPQPHMRANPAYFFSIKRAGRGGHRIYRDDEFDIYAFVALDRRIIAYFAKAEMPSSLVTLRIPGGQYGPGGKGERDFEGATFGRALNTMDELAAARVRQKTSCQPAILEGEDRTFDDVAAMRMASNAATAAGQSASAA
jgi:hypothetical protein